MRWTEAEYRAYLCHRGQGRSVVLAPRGNAVGREQSESQFQSQILTLCTQLGWEYVYHTFNSKRSAPGFPDLVLCKPGRLIFAELKREGAVLTLPQQAWLAQLRASVPGVEVYLWRPSDMESIVEILRGKTPRSVYAEESNSSEDTRV